MTGILQALLSFFRVQTTAANYIEDVFSTYLYTGTGASQTITNNINISTNGGLVWIKGRSGATGHRLTDTVRGATKSLESNSTAAEATESTGLTAFGTTGFTIGADADYNTNAATYVSWTFREQAKFFDVVTYTGNGSSLAVSHALASTPGCVFVKRLNSASDWVVGHRGSGSYWASSTLRLNTTAAGVTNGEFAAMSDTSVTVVNSGAGYGDVNTSGATYVMYLFAHNAGGFGASGTDNVISCGSFTVSGGTATVTLGYEPQWILYKRTNGVDGWNMLDTMRGFSVGSSDQYFYANTSAAEATYDFGYPTATGFTITGDSNGDYIYIAIRRGPMKTPTSGTSVFSLGTYTGNDSQGVGLSSGIVSDSYLIKRRNSTSGFKFGTRLISYPSLAGYTSFTSLDSTSTAAESAANTVDFSRDNITPDVFNVAQTSPGNWYLSGATYVNYALARAPGFFDVVCYSGNGTARSITHNLGVAPEFLMIKRRNSSGGSFPDDWSGWTTYATPNQNSYYFGFNLNSPWRTLGDVYWGSSPSGTPSMTATTFSLGTFADVNASSGTYVAYLFATVAGVSKVGTYTGNGSSQTINCGFTAGSRFVLIKRLDVAGSWYVWDSARGIVAGNDPYLQLNNTAAEVTTNDSVDTDNTGFIVNQLAATDINVNFSPYFFLAIA